MKFYGLIGYPLTHSFSKKFFTEKFEKENIEDHVYDLYELSNLSDFPELLRANPKLCGLNVTVPHKIGVVRYLDWVSEEAKEVGAVNCIRIAAESPVAAAFAGEVGIQDHDFKLEGFNTDVYGFEHSLKPLLKKHHKKALLLGNGGAARAVKCVLDKLDIEYKLVTRRPEGRNSIRYDAVTKKMMEEYTLIINSTPVGTSPNVDECPPIPYEYITSEHLLYDLIYNPEQTLFLKKGHEQGAATKNGYEMLVLQAERSWEIWNTQKVKP
ncbi:shikimate dehydrogenase family protein [Mucilaginibacter myungsuensis]|uniref:Shikimate dehydrogenase n=1 Tax=Mucilaginibacter myungsuensis TaxID=649104 RepID=A0A929KYH7_9SPHI|nr:shikimate dehydrogenase [Mucilaginibacter myungsuensis]MBE9664014.1 shikimate dehydrogenase [Mucilaginibacter myungsuensis]MDN3601193.1 shikimate dehydrogenase [Mucilaginibacter myungsuensis]